MKIHLTQYTIYNNRIGKRLSVVHVDMLFTNYAEMNIYLKKIEEEIMYIGGLEVHTYAIYKTLT